MRTAITQLIRGSHWRPLALAGAVAVVSATSAFGLNAWAHAPQAGSAASQTSEGHHAMAARHHHGGRMGFMPMDGRHLDRMLDEVKATHAQRTQIKTLAQTAQADLKPLRDKARTLHQQSLALFAQPQLDAAAAENLRLQMLAGHDAMSKRVLQAALDMGKVLTPEQRVQLVAKVQNHHGRMKHGDKASPGHPH